MHSTNDTAFAGGVVMRLIDRDTLCSAFVLILFAWLATVRPGAAMAGEQVKSSRPPGYLDRSCVSLVSDYDGNLDLYRLNPGNNRIEWQATGS
jgi:hypothetical protein